MVMPGVLRDAMGASVVNGVPVGNGVWVGLVVVTVPFAAGDDCGSAGTVGEAPLLHPLAKPANINTPKSTPVFISRLSSMAIYGAKTLRSGAAQQEYSSA